MQEEIAWQISEALRLKLTGEQKKKLRKRPTVNPEAYQEYLRGRHHWHNWNADSFQRAIEHFERALEHDPTYALAYAGLGNAFGALSYYGLIDAARGLPARPRGRPARARDRPEARRRARHARPRAAASTAGTGRPRRPSLDARCELDPDSALAHAVQSIFCITCGRFDEAMAAARRARALDPLSPFINMGVAWVHHFAGRHEEAIRELQDVLALRPGLEEAGNILITVLRGARALRGGAALITQQRCWGFSLDGGALLAAACTRGGRERLLARAARADGAAPATPPAIELRVRDRAHVSSASSTRRSITSSAWSKHHVGGSVFIGVDPVLSRLRGIPRYDAIVRRVGAPQPQKV